MNTIFKIKNSSSVKLLTALTLFSLLFVASCTKNKELESGLVSEPNAPVGFAEGSIEVLEGSLIEDLLEVNASKPVFEDIMYELEVTEGDGGILKITDKDGNTKDTHTILNGERLSTLLVSAPDDDKYTGDRDVVFVLKNLKGNGVFLADQNYSGNGVSVRTQLKITVKDNDPVPPLVSFNEETSEVEEKAGSHTVSINISDVTTKEETFDISFGGTADIGVDYNVAGINGNVLTVTVPAGQQAIDIPITIIDNTEKEDKTIVMNLSNYSNGLYQGDITKHTVTILDDDIPTEIIEIIATESCMIKGNKDADRNFGNNELELSRKEFTNGPDLSNTRSGLLKFDLTGVNPAAIMEGKMVLTTYNESASNRWPLAEGNVGGPVVQSLHYISDDSWSRATVTWNTTPELDRNGTGRFENPALLEFTYEPLVGTSGQTGIKHEYDLTSRLQEGETDNILSLGIQVIPNSGGARIYYRATKQADTSIHPKLVIKVRTDL